MAYNEKDLERFQKNELQLGDTFRFDCDMCGDCCRKRSEPILVTGADIFRAAQALDVTIEEVLDKYLEGYVGGDSHVPLYVLTERLDGSCKFLCKGKCMIHQNKPAVCALFPLGRMFDVRDNTYHYFVNVTRCHPGQARGREWTLREWLEAFSIQETEAMTSAWHRLMMIFAQKTCKMRKEDIRGKLLDDMRRAMYLDYDTGLPYIEQVEKHIAVARETFGRK